MNNHTDTELFELCRKVFAETSFDSKTEYWLHDGSGTVRARDMNSEQYMTATVPLYTSDYLMEKLPNQLHKDSRIHYLTLSAKYGDEFKANYITPTGVLYFFMEPGENTSLKALLRLTLALKENGVEL